MKEEGAYARVSTAGVRGVTSAEWKIVSVTFPRSVAIFCHGMCEDNFSWVRALVGQAEEPLRLELHSRAVFR